MSEMPPTIQVKVNGSPIPQPRVRVSTRGGFARAYVPRGHPVHDWRKAVSEAVEAELARTGRTGAFMGLPLLVTIHLVLPRAKSHHKANTHGNELKKSAPRHPTGPRSGDVDNHSKSILDALHGIAYSDDSFVVDLRVSKAYTDPRLFTTPGAVIHIAAKADPMP